jgi:hypothetical protein
MVNLLPMYVLLSSKTNIPLLTVAQEVDEIAVSSGAMKLEGFISLKGSRTKERIPCTLMHG